MNCEVCVLCAVYISWKIKCWILLKHGVTMKFFEPKGEFKKEGLKSTLEYKMFIKLLFVLRYVFVYCVR